MQDAMAMTRNTMIRCSSQHRYSGVATINQHGLPACASRSGHMLWHRPSLRTKLSKLHNRVAAPMTAEPVVTASSEDAEITTSRSLQHRTPNSTQPGTPVCCQHDASRHMQQLPQPAPHATLEPAAGKGFMWQHNWWPLMPLSYLDPSDTVTMDVLGVPLLVHQDDTGEWQCCPCSRQGAGEEQQCSIDGANAQRCSCSGTRYPTMAASGLLWVWPSNSPSAITRSRHTPLPLTSAQIQRDTAPSSPPLRWYLRDLPFDYRVVVEELTDPSQLGGAGEDAVLHRSDTHTHTSTSESAATGQADKTHAPPTFSYTPSGPNTPRSRISFHAPSLITHLQHTRNDRQRVTLMYVVPQGPGRCRVLTSASLSPSGQEGWEVGLQSAEAGAGAGALLKALRGTRAFARFLHSRLPLWTSHLRAHALFDSPSVLYSLSKRAIRAQHRAAAGAAGEEAAVGAEAEARMGSAQARQGGVAPQPYHPNPHSNTAAEGLHPIQSTAADTHNPTPAPSLPLPHPPSPQCPHSVAPIHTTTAAHSPVALPGNAVTSPRSDHQHSGHLPPPPFAVTSLAAAATVAAITTCLLSCCPPPSQALLSPSSAAAMAAAAAAAPWLPLPPYRFAPSPRLRPSPPNTSPSRSSPNSPSTSLPTTAVSTAATASAAAAGVSAAPPTTVHSLHAHTAASTSAAHAASDPSPVAEWLERCAEGGGPIFAPTAQAAPKVTRALLLDRWQQHTRHCPHCQQAMTNTTAASAVGLAAVAAAALLAASWLLPLIWDAGGGIGMGVGVAAAVAACALLAGLVVAAGAAVQDAGERFLRSFLVVELPHVAPA